MVLVTLRLVATPENRDALLDVVRGILEPTRVEEGCMSYHFYEQIDRKNAFAFVEEWKSLTHFKNHIRTHNYSTVLAIMDLLSEPPEIKINNVSYTAGMGFIEEVLRPDDGQEVAGWE